jgi:hypothetical protein
VEGITKLHLKEERKGGIKRGRKIGRRKECKESTEKGTNREGREIEK